jgi:hypothetical protein
MWHVALSGRTRTTPSGMLCFLCKHYFFTGVAAPAPSDWRQQAVACMDPRGRTLLRGPWMPRFRNGKPASCSQGFGLASGAPGGLQARHRRRVRALRRRSGSPLAAKALRRQHVEVRSWVRGGAGLASLFPQCRRQRCRDGAQQGFPHLLAAGTCGQMPLACAITSLWRLRRGSGGTWSRRMH